MVYIQPKRLLASLNLQAQERSKPEYSPSFGTLCKFHPAGYKSATFFIPIHELLHEVNEKRITVTREPQRNLNPTSP
jgi:hypothetical protein